MPCNFGHSITLVYFIERPEQDLPGVTGKVTVAAEKTFIIAI
jgi:hypothetical protein